MPARGSADEDGLLAGPVLPHFGTLRERRDLLEPVEAPSDVLEVAEDRRPEVGAALVNLAEPPVDLHELALDQRDQLVELAACHGESLTREPDRDSRVSDE